MPGEVDVPSNACQLDAGAADAAVEEIAELTERHIRTLWNVMVPSAARTEWEPHLHSMCAALRLQAEESRNVEEVTAAANRRRSESEADESHPMAMPGQEVGPEDDAKGWMVALGGVPPSLAAAHPELPQLQLPPDAAAAASSGNFDLAGGALEPEVIAERPGHPSPRRWKR